MWFSRKQVVKSPPDSAQMLPGQGSAKVLLQQTTTKLRGDAAESAAQVFLARAGLTLVECNYRTPGRGGGEIDLVMRTPDGTLVFVEVRQRAHAAFGGAAASVGWAKQRRIIFAARHYLQRLSSLPPCRFDVVALQGTGVGAAQALGDKLSIQWIRGAFDASGYS